jgi:putative ABC transport system ATP-binding protein
MGTKTEIVRAEGLVRTFGTGDAARRAVDDVSFHVNAGEVVLIFGPSGCGKSTLLGMVGGLDRAYSGKLQLFGKPVADLSDKDLSNLRGDRIGFVFQAFHLLGHLSVLENVSVPALFSHENRTPKQIEERALAVLERVGLADRKTSMPNELSGGQRQRVAIARALLSEPELLLCDEPTGNLDRKTGEQIIDLFAELHADLSTTIVIVTHEDRMTRLAHRTLHMIDGKLEAEA